MPARSNVTAAIVIGIIVSTLIAGYLNDHKSSDEPRVMIIVEPVAHRRQADVIDKEQIKERHDPHKGSDADQIDVETSSF